MKIKKLVIIILIIILCGCTNGKKNAHVVKKIDCEEKDSLLLDGAVLIDVRTNSEYEILHLDGAFNIGYNLIEKKIESIVSSKDTKIIVYCQSGARSSIAAQTLIDLGYENVYDLGSIDNCSNM